MTRTYTTTAYATHRRWFFSAFSLLFILFALYVYLISASVVYVVAGKELSRTGAEVASRVSELEAAYLAAADALAPGTIAAAGFVQPAATVYIVKAPANVAFSHDEN